GVAVRRSSIARTSSTENPVIGPLLNVAVIVFVLLLTLSRTGGLGSTIFTVSAASLRPNPPVRAGGLGPITDHRTQPRCRRGTPSPRLPRRGSPRVAAGA